VVVLMMALSGALAGLGGASEIGDFRHVLDPRGLHELAEASQRLRGAA